MRRFLVLIAAGALLLAGCGANRDGTGGGETDRSTWEFSAESLDGSTFEGTSIAGTPTVVWFWAPWCPTCRAQIPTVTRLAEEYDGQVEFIGAGGMAAEEQIRELAEQIPHLTHVIDEEGDVWNHFGVKAQSSYAVIDADGEILANGYLDNDDLVDLVAEMAG